MRKSLAAAAVSAVLGLSAAPAHAVTWGQPDTGNYPFVGTLLFRQGGTGYYSCTGTLLSPTVLLTAGHCVEGGDVPNEATWVTFDQVPSFAGRAPGEPLEAFLNRSPRWHRVRSVHPHPQYSDYAEFPNTFDVGVAILEAPVVRETYGALPARGLLDTLATGQGRQDRTFTAVGYGSQGVLPSISVDEWARYVGATSLIELNSTSNGDAHSAKFTNNPGGGQSGSGGTCYGDSGGPLFHGDSNVVGAVVSWGRTPCIGVDYQFRMDTDRALDFVSSFLQ